MVSIITSSVFKCHTFRLKVQYPGTKSQPAPDPVINLNRGPGQQGQVRPGLLYDYWIISRRQ
jgi:hypothetical protein